MSPSPSDLNMGVPWDSISQPAGGEQIPEIENLRTGLARALAPAGQLAGQEETQRAMENLRQMQATMKAHNDASQRPPQATKTTTKVDPNGNRTVSIEGPAELAEYYGKAGQFYQQALGGYAKQMDEIQQQLKAQEQNIRNQPPWVQLATALSANLASQKDMPGWVRGLGQTAAQLNPQADQIRNQRLGVLAEEANIAQKALATDTAAIGQQSKTVQADVKAHDAQVKLAQEAVKAGQIRSADDLDAYNLLSDKEKLGILSQSKAHSETIKQAQDFKSALKDKDINAAALRAKANQEAVDARARIHEANVQKATEARQGDISQRQAASREERAYAKVEKDTLAMSNTIGGIKHLREMLNENDDLAGVIEGRININLAAQSKLLGGLGWSPERVKRAAELRATFFTMLNDVKNTLGAGSYFWRPVEFGALSPKLARAVNDKQVNLGILDALENDVHRNAKRLVLGSGSVDWSDPRRQMAFGDIADDVFSDPAVQKLVSMGGIQGPAGGVKKGGTEKKPERVVVRPEDMPQ